MRGTNGDYLAGIDGSSADHRDYDAGVDDNLVCSRRSVCISDSVARIESGNPDWRFVVVSVVLLFFTRPWAVKYLNTRTVKTNTEALVGKSARVIADINNLKGEGQVVINGLEWTARSSDDTIIFRTGDVVTVVGIEGVKLIVEGQKKGD